MSAEKYSHDNCLPSTHCGAPVDHGSHPLFGGRGSCTGQACPNTATAMGIATRLQEKADRLLAIYPTRELDQPPVDLGIADSRCIERLSRIFDDPAFEDDAKLLAARRAIREARP